MRVIRGRRWAGSEGVGEKEVFGSGEGEFMSGKGKVEDEGDEDISDEPGGVYSGVIRKERRKEVGKVGRGIDEFDDGDDSSAYA